MKELFNHNLLAFNTFGIDAKCRRFLEFNTVDEAQKVARMLVDEPLLIVGEGSNLLLTGDYQGTVVHSAVKGLEPTMCNDGSVLLRVGSGEVFDHVVAYCIDHGWYGAENLSLIPGEVGASAVQNIGAYGVEVSQIIDKVEAVRIADGELVTFSNHDCCYGYRQSRFKQDWSGCFLITHVTYRLHTVFTPHVDYGNIKDELQKRGIGVPTAQQLRQVIIDIRQQKLPDVKVEGNAGSFFMNPVVERPVFETLLQRYPDMPHYKVDEQHEKIPAAWLIDQCGWKGRSMGRAGVHSRQALVLVNRGGATGQEVVTLCEAIRSDVKEKFGIMITPEVNII